MIDKDFKLKFKALSVLHKNEILNKLSSVFDLDESHFSKATLHRFYCKYPKISFKKDDAISVLNMFFSDGSFYIQDFDEKYLGGFLKTSQSYSLEATTNEHNVSEQIAHNWELFISNLRHHCVASDDIRFRQLTNYNFEKKRTVKRVREKMLTAGLKVVANNKSIESKFVLLDSKKILECYNEMICFFLPDFLPDEMASSVDMVRYSKEIETGLFLSFSVDYGFIRKELNRMNISYPTVNIELLVKNPNSFIVNQVEKVNVWFFMGHFVFKRITDSSEPIDIIKEKLFFALKTYCFYMEIYLELVSDIIKRVTYTN